MTTANRYLNIADDGTLILERGAISASQDETSLRLVSTNVSGRIDSSLLPPRAATTLEYAQSFPVDTWVINHNFGFSPVVQVFSLDRQLIACDVVHDSFFQIVTCLFTVPFAGYAILVVPYPSVLIPPPF